jgi:glycosyltransferase involved in cell wall biosynthesis
VADQRAPERGTVAVLIPVYNDRGRLASTLGSLANQGVALTAVVVDDGSDPPIKVDATAFDFAIVVLRNESNRGIEHALNTGLHYIRQRGFEYVARLDNGDVCAPGRLASQRDFLDGHPAIYLVGSAVEWRDDGGRLRFIRRFPATHDRILRALHHTTALIHPSVMFRSSVVSSAGMYSADYPAAEDLEFFWRIAQRHRVANLPATLVVTRFDPQGLSMRRRREQLRSTLRIQLAFFQPFVWTSYYGLLKTLGRFAVPYSWIVSAKAALSRRGAPAT